MRLELIVIQGFKSFAEKTEIKIFPGVTCVVGPNGCGKSNVADAVRWALGEQSPKILRGQKMEDVIFHGSSSRKPVGLAEVGLVFNNDGALDVPWSEVGVARRLYRTGESEYLLNTNACRLRDIQDLFAGTGVNPKAYALMDQDRLNHVLTAKPWERRIFIEEAAGVARYKQQRSETQGKLEATLRAAIQESDYRLTDLRQSAQKFQGELERLLERREQMGAQIRELGEEELRLAEEVRSLGERRAAVGVEREETIRGLGEARERFGERERQVRAFEADLEACRGELGRRREALEGLRLEQIRTAGERAEMTRSVGELRERLAQVERRRERLQGETTAARAEADLLAAARRRLESSFEQAGAQLSLLTGEREQVDQELQGQEGLRAQAQETLALLRVSLAAKESALESLLRLEREREGYGSGVRSLFSGQGAAAVAGVIGTVADLLDVPAGLEAAVEAVLGDRLQWVIVDRFEQGRAALSYLEREGAGAATLLALETLRGSAAPPPLEDDPEI